MSFDGERFGRGYLAVCLIVAPVGGWALLALTAWVNAGSWLGIVYTAFCYLCAVAVVQVIRHLAGRPYRHRQWLLVP